jgi:hypothetical protein
MTKIAGSGSDSGTDSGSMSQKHGSEDPDPDPPQNVMDPEHCGEQKHFGFNPIICNVSGYGEEKHFGFNPIICNVSGYGDQKHFVFNPTRVLSVMFLVMESKNILSITLPGYPGIICNVSGYGEQKHFGFNPFVCNVLFLIMENKNILANVQDNPLVPSLAQAAGPCITPNDCALCAKKVVALLQSMESQLMRSERTLSTKRDYTVRGQPDVGRLTKY